jgi:cytochrome c-type biogenesis protein CcmH
MIRTIVAALVFATAAIAVEPSERMADPALEARAREVSKALRCVVCQNETIDDSHAEIAKDMRLLVRERIKAGESNDQVIDYMVSRYGDFVLLMPRFQPTTVLLWLAPLLLLGTGIVVVLRRLKRTSLAAPGLSDEERKELAKLTGGGRP